MTPISFDSHPCSSNHLCGFPATPPSCPGHVKYMSVELGMFLLSARGTELEVRRDDGE